MEKYIKLLAVVILCGHLVNCTSTDTKEGETDEASLEQTEGEPTDGTSESQDVASNGDKTDEQFLNEQLPDETMGAQPPADGSATTASTDSPPPPAASEPPPMASNEVPPAPDSSLPGMVDTGGSPVADKPKASLQKVMAAPTKRSGILVNGVYVARPKDSYKTISQIIYGNDSKVKELKKVNSSISSPKPGDKIYYNSPMRPDDNSRMLTYFEESGAQPEFYVSKDGDDLKKVSKELLGYPNAWKEIWVTNPNVESKGALTAGVEIRYWRTKAEPKGNLVADNGMGAAGMNNPSDLPPPPPPPAMNELPPPPPPPPPVAASVDKKKPKKAGDQLLGLDDDMLMYGGMGIVAILAAVGFIVARKRKQSQLDSNTAIFSDTQIGTQI